LTKMIPVLDALSKRMKGQTPIPVVLAEMARESDAAYKGLAIQCLGAVRDLGGLLEALEDDQSAEGRRVAIFVLYHFLGQHPGHDLQLYQTLEKKYRSGPAEVIVSLLRNLSPENQTKPETYEQLIEYLKSDK